MQQSVPPQHALYRKFMPSEKSSIPRKQLHRFLSLCEDKRAQHKLASFRSYLRERDLALLANDLEFSTESYKFKV